MGQGKDPSLLGREYNSRNNIHPWIQSGKRVRTAYYQRREHNWRAAEQTQADTDKRRAAVPLSLKVSAPCVTTDVREATDYNVTKNVKIKVGRNLREQQRRTLHVGQNMTMKLCVYSVRSKN